MKTKANIFHSNKALAIFLPLFLYSSTMAIAQNSAKQETEAVAKITRYEVKKEYQQQFQKAISDYVLKSISEDSNIMSEAYFEQDNQAVIWLFERWINQSQLDKFSKNSESKTVTALTKTVLAKPEKIIDIKDLEPISKQQWRRTSRVEDDQLTIMLFVDAKSGTEANFTEVYHKAMPQFRSEAGVVTYQLSQFEEDKSQFVTFEKFRSKDAFQYHLNFPPIQPVIDYLNTNIKKQPFQDGIHNLIEFAPLIRE